jgi:hypothetical protein
VITAANFDHCIRATDTRVMAFPGYLSLIEPEGEMIDGMVHQRFPVQIGKLLSDDEEDLPQFVVGDGLQVNFLGNDFEKVVVGHTEGIDIGIDAKLVGSWMNGKHNGSFSIGGILVKLVYSGGCRFVEESTRHRSGR